MLWKKHLPWFLMFFTFVHLMMSAKLELRLAASKASLYLHTNTTMCDVIPVECSVRFMLDGTGSQAFSEVPSFLRILSKRLIGHQGAYFFGTYNMYACMLVVVSSAFFLRVKAWMLTLSSCLSWFFFLNKSSMFSCGNFGHVWKQPSLWLTGDPKV